MTYINRTARPLALALLLFGVCLGFPQHAKEQSSSLGVRQRFSVVPLYRHCEPVEVKVVSFGRQPKEALLAQVTIENRSEKVITGVKLGWRVYSEQEGTKTITSSCAAPPLAGKTFVSGTTPLIQFELSPSETSHIATEPLPLPGPATKTVFVDHAFVRVNDVESLPIDRYTLVAFVSEVHYADGTKWNRSQ